MTNDYNDTPNVTEAEVQSVETEPADSALAIYSELSKDESLLIRAAGRELISRRAKILLKLRAAADFGLSHTQAMRLLWVDDSTGAVKPTADCLALLVSQQTDCKFFGCVESNNKVCRWKGIRNHGATDVEYISTWTIERAKEQIRAIERKANWKSVEAMLRARACWECGHTLWPHLVGGCFIPEGRDGTD